MSAEIENDIKNFLDGYDGLSEGQRLLLVSTIDDLDDVWQEKVLNTIKEESDFISTFANFLHGAQIENRHISDEELKEFLLKEFHRFQYRKEN